MEEMEYQMTVIVRAETVYPPDNEMSCQFVGDFAALKAFRWLQGTPVIHPRYEIDGEPVDEDTFLECVMAQTLKAERQKEQMKAMRSVIVAV